MSIDEKAFQRMCDNPQTRPLDEFAARVTIEAYEAAKTEQSEANRYNNRSKIGLDYTHQAEDLSLSDCKDTFEKEWPGLFEHCSGQLAKWDIIPSGVDKFAWHHVADCGFLAGYGVGYEHGLGEAYKVPEQEAGELEKLQKSTGVRNVGIAPSGQIVVSDSFCLQNSDDKKSCSSNSAENEQQEDIGKLAIQHGLMDSPTAFAHRNKIEQALRAISDDGKSDAGIGFGSFDFWIKLDGIEYYFEAKPKSNE